MLKSSFALFTLRFIFLGLACVCECGLSTKIIGTGIIARFGYLCVCVRACVCVRECVRL